MNYYERHLGDYARDAGHLTMLEHGAYTLLLDRYYTTEQGIPADQAHRVCRARTRDEKEAVDTVLAEFFTLRDGVHHQKRVDAEIERYSESAPDREAKRENERERQRRARERRKELFDFLRGHGVVPAFDAPMSEIQAAVSRIKSQPVTPPVTRDVTATQTPDTRHQVNPPSPLAGETDRDAGDTHSQTIPCPYDRIVSLYHEVLPALPRAKLMPASRQKALRKVWGWVLSSTKGDGNRRATTTDEALHWLRGYFGRALANDFLMGRTPRSAEHANWQCDLDFLLTDKGMKQVIEKTQDAA